MDIGQLVLQCLGVLYLFNLLSRYCFLRNRKTVKRVLNKPLETPRSLFNDSFSNHRGTLSLRIGPMFSGKTTWLNGELTQLSDKGFSVLKIIHDHDDRYDVSSNDRSGSTHNSSYKSLTDKISVIRTKDLKSIDVSDFNVIGIDEAQFFENLVSIVEKWVEVEGKHVRVTGLDGDSFKEKFGDILDLIPLCDDVTKLKASCKICLEELISNGFNGNILAIEAAFTKRLDDSNEQLLVGGIDKYIPVCRYHHNC